MSGQPAAGSARTIVDWLTEQATRRGDRPAFTVVDLDGRSERISFADLEARALRLATGLRERGLRQGDRVLICLPTSLDLLVSVYGVLAAGAVCVPLYPPFGSYRLDTWREQASTIARFSQPRGAVVEGPVRLHMRAVLEAHGPDLFLAEPAELESRGLAERARVLAEDLVFIQFTSGTTRRPRGVAISHSALMANIEGIIAAMSLTEEDVSVSWLPPYHDMGLVGHIFTPVRRGLHQHLMPPLRFLFHPLRWLELCSEVQATQTTAPNFAYSMCARRITAADRRRLDLAPLRTALNGAELVQAGTLEAFCAAFAEAGFSPSAFRPVYGLAEATLAVTFPMSGGARVDWVDRRELASQQVARTAPPGQAQSQAFVSVGVPLSGTELRIVDEQRRELAEREVGEICVRGPSLMDGYYNNPSATAEVIRDGWLHTGDLGYLAGGELHVIGRRKEIIIKAGRNYLPHDFETACDEVPELRPGRAAAFGISNRQTGTEDVALLVEVRDAARCQDAALQQRVAAVVQARTGVRPDRIELLAPGTLPKTTSGKMQRLLLREMLDRGRLPQPTRVGRWLGALPLPQRARSLLKLIGARGRRFLGWK